MTQGFPGALSAARHRHPVVGLLRIGSDERVVRRMGPRQRGVLGVLGRVAGSQNGERLERTLRALQGDRRWSTFATR